MNDLELEFKKATKALKGVSLSESQKNSMLDSIYQTGATAEAVPSPWSWSLAFNNRYATACAALVLMLTGTAYAAGESLPGDPLYALKVEVIEPVAMSLRFSEEAKNDYRLTLLQERISEIQILKDKGRLNFDLESISSEITKENLEDIEHSAVFGGEGENLEVSGQVETYNSIVDEAHRLETIIRVPDIEREAETELPLEEKEKLKEDQDDLLEDVSDTIEKSTNAAKDAALVVPDPAKKAEDAVNEAKQKIEEPVESIPYISL